MKVLPIILLLSFSCKLFAQGEIDNQDRTFWRNERSWGASANSNGWNIGYYEYRQTKPGDRLFVETEFGSYKDSKEVKIQNYYYNSPYSFKYGKINSNWHISIGLGYQHEIFEKRDMGGVSISWFAAGGPVLTFCKPIYYKVVTVDTVNNVLITKDMKFDLNSVMPIDIYGRSSFFKGFDEMKLYPGVYGYGGFSFEYSKNDRMTKTVEVGASMTGYLRKIPIMDNEYNKQVFFSLFVSYKIGIILEPLKMKNDFLYNLFNHKKDKS
jgi:hypothetical protein